MAAYDSINRPEIVQPGASYAVVFQGFVEKPGMSPES